MKAFTASLAIPGPDRRQVDVEVRQGFLDVTTSMTEQAFLPAPAEFTLRLSWSDLVKVAGALVPGTTEDSLKAHIRQQMADTAERVCRG